VVAVVTTVAAATVDPPMAAVTNAVVAVTPEAEATGTAMPMATHVSYSMPTTESMRYAVPRETLTSVTLMVSPHSRLGYMSSYYPRTSSLLGSPSMTRSKTQYSSYIATP
jgi:hypothetical protein